MDRLLPIGQMTPARWALAIGWTLLLTLLLLQPETNPVIDLGLPRGDSSLQREIFFSALHLLAFALTCLLWFWALTGAFTLRTSLFIAVLIAIALGVLTESLQTLTQDRHASWIDLLANSLGAMAAARFIWRRYL
ncbi:MAG: VanZ family protein [Chloroflexota bacterium]|nr:VanZ family protein [Chloroflexota bacterium]